jgi:hypothetical protein
MAVSSLINVGHVVHDPSKIIGFAKRQKWLQRWKEQLGL